MHFLVLGGNGRTGSLVISDALSKGHTVTALVRNSASLAPRPGLTIVQGTPQSAADISAAFSASPSPPSAFISALNAPRASDSPFAKPIAPPHLLAECATNTVAVMKEQGVKRLVVLSVFGVADSQPNIHWLLNLMLRRTNMAVHILDHEEVDGIVKDSGLDFTVFRPVRLTDDETGGREVKDCGDGGKGVPMLATVSRISVAECLVDAAANGTFVGRTPVIRNV